MNQLLLLSILEVVEKGESFGFHTVKNDIQKWESFVTLTDQQFKEHWDVLIENTCLLRHTAPNTVQLNPEKNCIVHYKNAIEKENQQNAQKREVEWLTLENLKYENDNRDLKTEVLRLTKELSEAQKADIPINAQDRKTVIFWQIATTVSITVAFLLKLFGVKGWL